MKKIITLIVFFGLSTCILSAQAVKMKKNPVGKWIFNAPYAPYGYSTGTAEIGIDDDSYTVKMLFTETGYSYSGENVKVKNDTMFFEMFLEGNTVNVSLVMESDTAMTGESNYYEGSIPFTMKKDIKKEE